MRPSAEIPDDPELPGIAAIRRGRLAGAELGALCGYTRGSRATFEGRWEGRRAAVKLYAQDPAGEAALYQALARAGLGGDTGARVPPLLAWERELHVLVIGWLDGPTSAELIKSGRGGRAGELAAHWLHCASSVRMRLGVRHGAAPVLDRMQEWITALRATDPALGARAGALAERLACTQPGDGSPRLVHGTLYDRHVLDLGDGPGVIDWQRFGSGALELDASVFLATVARLGLHPEYTGEAARAQETLLAATDGLLDEQALAWYRAAALLHLARRRLHRRTPAEARVLLDEAARHAQTL